MDIVEGFSSPTLKTRSACAQYEYLVARNAYPSRKYEGAAYHDIAAALNVAVSSIASLEFARRLALAAITAMATCT